MSTCSSRAPGPRTVAHAQEQQREVVLDVRRALGVTRAHAREAAEDVLEQLQGAAVVSVGAPYIREVHGTADGVRVRRPPARAHDLQGLFRVLPRRLDVAQLELGQPEVAHARARQGVVRAEHAAGEIQGASVRLARGLVAAEEPEQLAAQVVGADERGMVGRCAGELRDRPFGERERRLVAARIALLARTQLENRGPPGIRGRAKRLRLVDQRGDIPFATLAAEARQRFERAGTIVGADPCVIASDGEYLGAQSLGLLDVAAVLKDVGQGLAGVRPLGEGGVLRGANGASCESQRLVFRAVSRAHVRLRQERGHPGGRGIAVPRTQAGDGGVESTFVEQRAYRGSLIDGSEGQQGEAQRGEAGRHSKRHARILYDPARAVIRRTRTRRTATR